MEPFGAFPVIPFEPASAPFGKVEVVVLHGCRVFVEQIRSLLHPELAGMEDGNLPAQRNRDCQRSH